jgi:hypothetical protein
VAIRFGVSSTVKNRLPRYSNFWDGTAVYSPFSPTGSYDALATYTVPSGGISQIEFAGIPTGGQYTHLQIRAISRTTRATAGADDTYIYFNNDTTNANYYSHQLYGTGASAGAGASAEPSNGGIVSQGNNGTANVFGVGIVDVLDFANINKYKVCRSLGGVDSNSTNGFIELTSVLWKNTSAINSIILKSTGGANFMQYSQFALYGVKG